MAHQQEGDALADTIERIDWDEAKVYVERTKDQIKDSHRFKETTLTTDSAYRDQLGTSWRGTYM